MSGTALINAAAASFRYAGSARAVGPFDFVAHAGEFHLVSGPSGCGKSTLARLLCGLIPHLFRGELGGRVDIGGQRSERLPLWNLTAVVGFVAQNPSAQLLTSTVRDEIVFGLENLGLSRRAIQERVEEGLSSFGLSDLADRDPRHLSGGEQQKLLLAAIVARRPPAVVLDEPLSMLDGASAHQLVSDLEALRRAGSAVVTFEHREAFFAAVDGVKRRTLRSTKITGERVPELPARMPVFRLVVDGFSVELGGRPVLQGIECTLAGGQVVGVVGANGSGKTTLLRALAGLQPHRGRVNAYVSGSHPMPQVGLCFQNPDRQIFNPTVRQELRFGLAAVNEDLYAAVVDLLGLAAYEETPPLLLSEGEKKRLALGTLLLRPGLSGVCLDEPTLGQDAHHRRLLGRVARQLAAAGYLCVVATHDLEWVAEWCDHFLVLESGQLVAAGKPEIITNSEQGRERRCTTASE
jgi:energy-coupling factor transport system ATP-binding protein